MDMDVLKNGTIVESVGGDMYDTKICSPVMSGTECDTNTNESTRSENQGMKEEELTKMLNKNSPTIQLNDKLMSENDAENDMRLRNVSNPIVMMMNTNIISGDQNTNIHNGENIGNGSNIKNMSSSDEIIIAISECPISNANVDNVFGNGLTEECKSASVPALTPTMFDDTDTEQEGRGEKLDMFESYVNGSFAHSYNLPPLLHSTQNGTQLFAQQSQQQPMSLDSASVLDRSGRRTTVAIVSESRGGRKNSRRPRHPLRRAHSLGSTSLLNQGSRVPVTALTGRTRKLYCPRQPPTTLTRTLSIARSNIETHKKSKKLSLKQKWILFCISLVSITSFLCMSIMAPFFPNEASNKGMSETVSGFVFSFYALIVMISSPILGSLLPVIGAKFMLISGIFASGVSNILFGTLDRIVDLTSFTVFCFIVRATEAIGVAAFSTASYTYIMYVFPDDIGTAFGLTETCVGIGMSLGPAVGAGLYALGGYGLPFYVLGTFVLLNIPLCWYVIDPIAIQRETTPEIEEDGNKSSPEVGTFDTIKTLEGNQSDVVVRKKKKKSTYMKLVKIPEVAVVCMVVVIVSQSQGFLDPTVEPHFRQYGLGTHFVGFVFLLMSAAYAILSPIVGWVAGKIDNKFPLMIIGLIISAIGLALIGPSSFIGMQPSAGLSSFAMVIMGLAYAVAFIPTFECLLVFAIDHGFPDNVKTYSLVSGLWSSMYSLGEVIGPSLGGIFVDLFKFPRAATLMALFSLIGALVTTLTYVFGGKHDGHHSSNNNNNSSFESSSSHPTSSSSSSSSNGSLNESISCSRFMPSGGEDEGDGIKFKPACNGTCCHHRSKPSSPSHHGHKNGNTKICGVAAISVGTADSGILGDINPSMSTLNHCCDSSGGGRKKDKVKKGEQGNKNSSKKSTDTIVVKSQEVSPLLNKNKAPPSTYGSGDNLNHLPTTQQALWTVKV